MTISDREPRVTLPTTTMVVVVLVVPLVFALAWAALVRFGNWDQSALMPGIAGATIVAFVSLLGVIAVGPWGARAPSEWMTRWLGGTVLRMLVTPLVTYLLYSATSLEPRSLTLAVALSYIATLMIEAVLLARHLGRQLPALGTPAVSGHVPGTAAGDVPGDVGVSD